MPYFIVRVKGRCGSAAHQQSGICLSDRRTRIATHIHHHPEDGDAAVGASLPGRFSPFPAARSVPGCPAPDRPAFPKTA